MTGDNGGMPIFAIVLCDLIIFLCICAAIAFAIHIRPEFVILLIKLAAEYFL